MPHAFGARERLVRLAGRDRDHAGQLPQALGVEGEQLARTGQLALAVMDSDHTRSVGSQFRGGLMAEVTDELSDKAVWCRGGDFRTRIEHAASVRPPGEAGRAGGH